MSNPSDKSKTLSFADAAEQVLQEANTPLHYKKLTKIALDQGLNTTSQTPWHTMYSVIHKEIKHRNAQGEPQRFKISKGFIHLEKDIPKTLAFTIKKHNKGVRDQILKQLRIMDSRKFEEFVSDLLNKMGFEENNEITPKSRDGGIDVRGTLTLNEAIKVRIAVQVKCWGDKNSVGPKIVRQVRGCLKPYEQGMIITTSKFTKFAREEADNDAAHVALIDGEQLVKIMVGLDHDMIEKQPQNLLSLTETIDID